MINSLTSDQHSGSKAGWPVLIQINTGIAAALLKLAERAVRRPNNEMVVSAPITG
jgi:hypothetical protein